MSEESDDQPSANQEGGATPIVCGTDFSEQSRHAALAAASLAGRLSSNHLRLVHVLEPGASVGDAGLRAAALARLKDEADGIRSGSGVAVSYELLNGSVSQCLPEFAGSMNASLLIVSSKGHGNSPLFRVGGTSERVAQLATMPLLVVRDSAPFVAWGQGSRPLRVFLGLDFSASAEPAIRWVKALRAAAACDVVVGHVYYAFEAASRYGLVPRGGLIEPDAEIERLVLRDMESRVGDLGGSGRVIYRAALGLGRLGDHLLDLAGRERADLIVVGTHHKRGFARLTSVSGIALHFGYASVACIPTAARDENAVELPPPVRRVLACTDLSPFSNRAIGRGYAVLGDREGEMFLLHVLPSKEASDVDAERSTVAKLLALVPATARSGRVSTRPEIEYGADVAGTICEVAERLDADVICLASHGRSGMARTLLGSVAEAVLRRSQRPVLVVKSPPE